MKIFFLLIVLTAFCFAGCATHETAQSRDWEFKTIALQASSSTNINYQLLGQIRAGWTVVSTRVTHQLDGSIMEFVVLKRANLRAP